MYHIFHALCPQVTLTAVTSRRGRHKSPQVAKHSAIIFYNTKADQWGKCMLSKVPDAGPLSSIVEKFKNEIVQSRESNLVVIVVVRIAQADRE